MNKQTRFTRCCFHKGVGGGVFGSDIVFQCSCLDISRMAQLEYLGFLTIGSEKKKNHTHEGFKSAVLHVCIILPLHVLCYRFLPHLHP